MKRSYLAFAAGFLLLAAPAAADEPGAVPWGSAKYRLEFCHLRETAPELEESWAGLAAAEQKRKLEQARSPAEERYKEVSADYKEAMKKWDIDALRAGLEKDTGKGRETFANWLGEENAQAYAEKVGALRSLLAKAETQDLSAADVAALERYLTPEAVATIRSVKSAYDAKKKSMTPAAAAKPVSSDKLSTYAGKGPLTGDKLSTMYDNATTGSGEVPMPGAATAGPGAPGSVLPLAGGRGSNASTIESATPPVVEGEPVKKGGGRFLSQDEKALVREVYGNKVDASKVKIISGEDMTLWGRILTSGGAAVTWGNTVYFPNDERGKSEYSFEKQPEWLVHEMGHVGQYQGWGEEGKGGWGYAAKSVWEQVTKGKDAYSIGKLDPNKAFDDYGIEQQAVIVEGYYNTLSGNAYGRGYADTPEQRAAMEAILKKKGLYPGLLATGGKE